MGFCQKDNLEIPLSKGCRHPKGYCKFRDQCIIHFFEMENSKDRTVVGGKDECVAGKGNEHPSYQR